VWSFSLSVGIAKVLVMKYLRLQKTDESNLFSTSKKSPFFQRSCERFDRMNLASKKLSPSLVGNTAWPVIAALVLVVSSSSQSASLKSNSEVIGPF
jgi:hypothetical protein